MNISNFSNAKAAFSPCWAPLNVLNLYTLRDIEPTFNLSNKLKQFWVLLTQCLSLKQHWIRLPCCINLW